MNILENPYVIICINFVLFFILIMISKKIHYSHLNYYILLLNVYIALIEPVVASVIELRLRELIEYNNHFNILHDLFVHTSYILSAKGFHIAYVCSSYYRHKISLKKSTYLLLMQFIPLLGLLAVTRELFYDHIIDKRIIFVSFFVSVLFFLLSILVFFYVGYMVSSF